jgi:hypothetical protein
MNHSLTYSLTLKMTENKKVANLQASEIHIHVYIVFQTPFYNHRLKDTLSSEHCLCLGSVSSKNAKRNHEKSNKE